ncbi:MAG: pantoate--beta-alanine ligase [Acidobacteria bacterium]|nr:pantoate--beta-alanine ligase [Acidobacteriota bacterium]
MRIVTDAGEFQALTTQLNQEKNIIGFVPTMGALHEGHLSLVRAARAQTDVVIASVFVNPTQFGPNEDLNRYPRNLERDAELLAATGVDYLFAPRADEIYPAGFATYVSIEELSEVLEGASRPGHFRGVATVLTILFHLVNPHKVFMGQKDAQQTVVVKKLVQDLRFACEIIVVSTMREADGLAMSSRNQYLNPSERQAATVLFRALSRARELYSAGERNAENLRQAMIEIIAAEPEARLDYVAITDNQNLTTLSDLVGKTVLISMAVKIGKTRLIDNIILP